MRSLILIFVLTGTCVWSNAYSSYIRTRSVQYPSSSSKENMDQMAMNIDFYEPDVLSNANMIDVENGDFQNGGFESFNSSTEHKIPLYEDDTWKLEEREKLFWIFQDGKNNFQELKKWQTEQEIRLLALAVKLNMTLEQMNEWQQQQLDHYTAVVNKSRKGNIFHQDWQRREKGRIIWLIQQNRMTQEDLERWMNKYEKEIKYHAHKQTIPSEYLIAFYHEELRLLNPDCSEQINMLNSTVNQLREQSRHDEEQYKSILKLNKIFNDTQKQQIDLLNSSVNQLREQSRLDEEQYKSLEKLYKIVKDEQKKEIDQLNSTVNKLQEQIKFDEERYKSLEKLYDILKNQTKENKKNQSKQFEDIWIYTRDQRSEMKKKLEKLEKLDDLVRNNYNFTIDTNKIKLDPDYLHIINKIQQLPIKKYHAKVEEIEKWIREELQHFLNESKLNLTTWQKYEQERILQLAQLQRKLSALEFEEQLLEDRKRLVLLAYQYHISVKEIEDWIRKEVEDLENKGIIGNLKNWQKIERSKISIYLKETNITIEEFEKQFKKNGTQIQILAQIYQITVEDIEEWYIEEAIRYFKPKVLKKWQIVELNRLQKLIQDENLRLDELKIAINNDIKRIMELAVENQVTIEEIEDFIKNEGKLLIKPNNKRQLNLWQLHEQEYLLALIQSNQITKSTNFEDLLTHDKIRIQKVATYYEAKVNDILEFWRKEYKRYIKLNLISEGEANSQIAAKWHVREQIYIQYLLEDHIWSIEELERKLRNDRKRLQQLAYYYDVNINEIEDWYVIELQKLLKEKKLHSEDLTNWQKIEKNRLYTLIVDQEISIEEVKKLLKNNSAALKILAAKYKITLYELTQWHLKELERLAYLGYGKSRSLKNWEIIENKRLRRIPEMVNITREELLTFIKSDRLFRNNLIAKYKVSPQELLKIQEKELKNMEDEGIFENLNLKHIEDWQRQELDRLYSLIRTQNFSYANLKEWQTDARIVSIASLYNLAVKTLIMWQNNEMLRIENVAKHYKMDLLSLEDFRDSEMDRLEMVAHKDYLAEVGYNNWEAREMRRLNSLMAQMGLSKVQLDKWRRKLYLLAQGLIDLDFDEEGYGDIELTKTMFDKSSEIPSINDDELKGEVEQDLNRSMEDPFSIEDENIELTSGLGDYGPQKEEFDMSDHQEEQNSGDTTAEDIENQQVQEEIDSIIEEVYKFD